METERLIELCKLMDDTDNERSDFIRKNTNNPYEQVRKKELEYLYKIKEYKEEFHKITNELKLFK